jgi:glycine/serine hydroxymethyltransferase
MIAPKNIVTREAMGLLKMTLVNKYAEGHSRERNYDDYKRRHLIKTRPVIVLVRLICARYTNIQTISRQSKE